MTWRMMLRKAWMVNKFFRSLGGERVRDGYWFWFGIPVVGGSAALASSGELTGELTGWLVS